MRSRFFTFLYLEGDSEQRRLASEANQIEGRGSTQSAHEGQSCQTDNICPG